MWPVFSLPTKLDLQPKKRGAKKSKKKLIKLFLNLARKTLQISLVNKPVIGNPVSKKKLTKKRFIKKNYQKKKGKLNDTMNGKKY